MTDHDEVDEAEDPIAVAIESGDLSHAVYLLREKNALLTSERDALLCATQPDRVAACETLQGMPLPSEVTSDVDMLAAFFGDGEWSMPDDGDDGPWHGEVFRGADVVGRIREAMVKTHGALMGACRTALELHRECIEARRIVCEHDAARDGVAVDEAARARGWSMDEDGAEDRGDLFAQLLAERDRLSARVDELIRAELGAVIVAMEATGVSADAVRATAASKAIEFVPGDKIAATRAGLHAEIDRLTADLDRLRAQAKGDE